MKTYQAILLLVVAAIFFYLVCPKYEFYQSKEGVVIYRFNKITGTIQGISSVGGNDKWYNWIPNDTIKKP